MKTLVIGYGNPLRSDDGIGPYVAGEIQRLRLPDVTAQAYQQLNVELVEECAAFERVIFIDAGSIQEPFRFQMLEEPPEDEGGGSHYLHPQVLFGLAKRLSLRVPEFFLCTVQGMDFDFGEGFSDEAVSNARQAIHFIYQTLAETLYA